MDFCLLLTACINPHGMSHTALQDPYIRKNQYITALRYYLLVSTVPIIFVENSGYDISDEFQEEIAEGKIEMLIYDGNDYDLSKGKGYGEALNIKYAFDHSRIISNCKYIVKITGRLVVNNYRTLITDFRVCPKTDLLVSYLCEGFLDSRFYIAKTTFYKDIFLPQIKKIDDSKGYYFESHLIDCKKVVSWRPFLLALPSIIGISGTYGTKIESPKIYSKDYWRKMKLNWNHYIHD